MVETVLFVHHTFIVVCFNRRSAISQEIIESQTRTLRELGCIWSDMGVHGEAKTARLNAVRTHVLVSLFFLFTSLGLKRYCLYRPLLN